MILYLPGFSIKNKNELQSICSALSKEGFEVTSHEWQHWQDENKTWDPKKEIELIQNKMFNTQPDIIIAKSIGTFITSRLIWQKLVNPRKVILMGIPLNDLTVDEKEIMQLSLKRIKQGLSIIQNNDDTHGSYLGLQPFLKDIPHNLIVKDSDTHEYNYPNEVLSLIRE